MHQKERKDGKHRHWHSGELQGKVGRRFLSDGKVRPQAVSEKIILAGGYGIFPENLAFPEASAVGPL